MPEHDDTVGAVGGNAEIMGDQQHRGADLAPEIIDQIEDAALDGDVERRGRLVSDDQLGLERDGDGDEDALAHAARQLVRILPGAQLRIG